MGLHAAADGIDDICPKPAERADLGDCQVKAAAQPDAEGDLPGGGFNIEPGVGQSSEILDPRGDGEGDVGDGRGTCVVVRRGRDLDRGHQWCILRCPCGQVGHLPQYRMQRRRKVAVAREPLQGIGVEAAAKLAQRHACLFGEGDIEAGGREEGRTGIEMEAGHSEFHAVSETANVGDGGDTDAITAGQLHSARIIGIQAVPGRPIEPQINGGHAAVEILEDLRVSDSGIWMRVLLANIPSGEHIAQRLRAAHERWVARQSGRIAGCGKHLLGVERLQFDAFVAVREHAFGERHAFEIRFHFLLPCRAIDRREVGAKTEFFSDRDHDELQEF